MDIGVEQFDLFTVPAWRADFAWLGDDVPGLVTDLDALLAASDLPGGYPGRQTRPVLQDIDAERWQRLHSAIGAVGAGVIDANPGRFARPGARLSAVRSWALELEAPYDLRVTRHSHAGATLSSVLWLTLPAETTSAAGTTFLDPLAFLQPSQSGSRSVDVAPVALQVVVFPWWVEHFPTTTTTASEGRRIVVASDLTFT